LRGLGLGLAGAMVVAACLGMTPMQFNTAPPLPVPDLDRSGRSADEQTSVTRDMQARQLKRLREEHQKQIFLDAERMVQLATALKKEVDQGNQVSPDAMKSADEIGKLAKRVSDRIKTQ
jgi:hypothetical protein